MMPPTIRGIDPGYLAIGRAADLTSKLVLPDMLSLNRPLQQRGTSVLFWALHLEKDTTLVLDGEFFGAVLLSRLRRSRQAEGQLALFQLVDAELLPALQFFRRAYIGEVD